jgi:serine/threonine protein kinase
MAPERNETALHDVRSDIWSLGIMFVEFATSKFPYSNEITFDTIVAI